MISFGSTPDILNEFNTYEALFWLVVALSLFLIAKWLQGYYHKWLYFSAVNLLLFGITDVVEVYTGGFLHTATWLFYWKAVHVLGIAVSIVWYFRLRLKRE